MEFVARKRFGRFFNFRVYFSPGQMALSSRDEKPGTIFHRAAIITNPSQWSGDSAQWLQEKKLQSLNPLLKPKVVAVLNSLKKQGFQPKIVYRWRSVSTQ
ncbi:MAG: hypothetical protein P8163_00200 [Candidatus Thiodiazotropha sp.]